MPYHRERLRDWTQDELVQLVERMIHRHADLAMLLDGPPPGCGAPIDRMSVERQLKVAFRRAARRSWREGLVLSREIEDIADLGQTHLDRGEVENGVEVLVALGRAIRDGYDRIHDSESEVSRVIDRCIDGLECALTSTVGDLRARVLDELLAGSVWGWKYGVAERGPDILVERTTDQDRVELATRVEQRLDETKSEWDRQRLGRLLLRLRRTVDPEEQIEVHRRAGNYQELVELLVSLHRPEEAAGRLVEIEAWRELVIAADAIANKGYVSHARDVVEKLVGERRTMGRWMALEWLAEQAEQDEKPKWAVELFLEAPTAERWLALRQAGVKGQERDRIRHKLEAEGRYELLIRILLAEGQPRWAYSQYRTIRDRTPEVLSLGEKLADALTKRKPGYAAAIYREIADAEVARGDVRDYEVAVDLVKRASDALNAAGNTVLAKRFVEEFWAKHRNRRLLGDELSKAGLGFVLESSSARKRRGRVSPPARSIG